jgi:flagellar assembly protein FliH
MARLVLPSFDEFDFAESADFIPGTAAGEEKRLAAYETGYKAGWDDAVEAEANTQRRIRADLARNLQEMSFTYHEARTAVLKQIEPLMQGIVSRVLPELARDTLGHTIAARLQPLARGAAEPPVRMLCSPTERETLLEALGDQDFLPLEVEADPLLAEGQVHLKFGDTEEMIDLDSAIRSISGAVAAFFHTELPKEHRAHG